MAEPQRLSIIIPVNNEERTLAELVERVRAVPVELEVIAVDDGSEDSQNGTCWRTCRLPRGMPRHRPTSRMVEQQVGPNGVDAQSEG
jgi:hypothetical protein